MQVYSVSAQYNTMPQARAFKGRKLPTGWETFVSEDEWKPVKKLASNAINSLMARVTKRK